MMWWGTINDSKISPLLTQLQVTRRSSSFPATSQYSSASCPSFHKQLLEHGVFAKCPFGPSKVDFVPQLGRYSHRPFKNSISFLVRAGQVSSAPSSSSQDGTRRRHLLATGAALAPWVLLSNQNNTSFAAENKKGFLAVLDKKDQYSFLYPFGWQEVVIEGQDKVYKDVIEPLESVSVNLIPTNKQDVRDLGPPKEVAEALIKKVLAPPSQKTKLVEATEHDVDGTAYYTFEFIAQAPNYTRHALSTICIANGKFYTLTTGANERRWEKMKDKLHTVVDSFKIGNV